jgi:hypothetical protein
LHTILEVCDSISTIVIILDLLFVYSLQYILMKMVLHNCLHGHEATNKHCFILICFYVLWHWNAIYLLRMNFK